MIFSERNNMECVVSLSFFIFRQNSENYDGIYVAFPLKRKKETKSGEKQD